MQNVLIDSSVLIETEHKKFKFERFLSDQGGATIAISVVTYMELMFGIIDRKIGSKKRQAVANLSMFLKSARVVEFDMTIAEHYAILKKGLRKRGRSIPGCDLMIAATAIAYGYKLAAFDKHFDDNPEIGFQLMDLEKYKLLKKL